MVNYCKNCGNKLEEDSVFCDACGTKSGESKPGYPVFDELFKSYKIDMIESEEVIRHSQIHSGCMILPGVILAVGIILGIVTWFSVISFNYSVAFAFIGFFNIFTVIGLIWLIIRYIGYRTNDLILTNKRVFGKIGLISTTHMQAPLNKIDSVSFSSGVIGKIIGYGTVQIATNSSVFKFRFIRNGQTFYNDIFNQLEISQKP